MSPDDGTPPLPASYTIPPQLASFLLSPTFSFVASTTVSTASSSPTSFASSPSSHQSRPGAENGECKLLGPFALFVQAALGLLALVSLVYKRWRERPQRPLKIWAFDASKQVVGSALLHVANLLISMVGTGELKVKAEEYQANPCSFYLLNLAIDTTIGIPILVVLLRLLEHGFSLTPLAKPPESIHSGNYGRPPKVTWWLKQCLIYFLGLLGMKACVYFIFKLCPWIIRVGDWALRWTEGNEMLQVFFVMLFFPVLMNALQYYIIDSFIKDKNPSDHETLHSEDEEDDLDSDDQRQRSGSNDIDSDDEEDVRDEVAKEVAEVTTVENKEKRKLRVDPSKLGEYDPNVDGEGSGGSGEPELTSPSTDDAKTRGQKETLKET